ncbi:hypothetical protein HYH03_014295 [Edaphochlamys debaryana]|uniref:Uncharacterized protein n=1 Tax=Edaphochlamys debaryana TaxID=47281 RepID=A0A835XNZ4_9CHLO|nr:hypothetical protein HYH03_014295 [Edaphochlamys debaryana]|eukprot:KAG2487049.1 hypothetical protein HYH03_014295 [Edaphochlamys debaryana]
MKLRKEEWQAAFVVDIEQFGYESPPWIDNSALALACSALPVRGMDPYKEFITFGVRDESLAVCVAMRPCDVGEQQEFLFGLSGIAIQLSFMALTPKFVGFSLFKKFAQSSIQPMWDVTSDNLALAVQSLSVHAKSVGQVSLAINMFFARIEITATGNLGLDMDPRGDNNFDNGDHAAVLDLTVAPTITYDPSWQTGIGKFIVGYPAGGLGGLTSVYWRYIDNSNLDLKVAYGGTGSVFDDLVSIIKVDGQPLSSTITQFIDSLPAINTPANFHSMLLKQMQPARAWLRTC